MFHAQCLPEGACVACMLANCAPLPGQPQRGKGGRAKGGAQPKWVQYATRA